MKDTELLEKLKIGETVDVECKEAESNVPNSLWQSYSAMANTNGGIIILGIKENKSNHSFEVNGVKNIDKRIKDFWNTINSNKVNKNLLKDEDIEKINIDGNNVLVINVPRAYYKERPIYINENPYKGTYKRSADGDYRCTVEEVNAMIRDASEEGNDGAILDGYTISDLDEETVSKYRNRFSSRLPNHPWNSVSNEEFIEMIGGISKDRRKNIRGVTVAGMLMFGKGLNIRDLFDTINLDYREEIDLKQNSRWSDRFTIDGTWENNLFNFYFAVVNKLTSNVKVPFKLENLVRKDDTLVHQAIREAFVNQIIHADFNIQGTLKIIKTKDCLVFVNPGSLKIELESIFKGGNSKSRNPRLQKMFSYIGLGEGAGSGFPKILTAWNEQNWRIPELNEDNNLMQVSLKLWMISMLPEDCLEKLKESFGDAFKLFSKEEVLVLATALLEGSVNNARIQLMTDKHSFEITGILRNLVEKKALIEDGYGKGKVYYLNHYFKNDINVFASYLKEEAQQKAQEEAQDKHSENKEEWLSTIEKKIVELLKKENTSKSDIANALGYESITGNLKRALKNLIDNGIIDYTIPDKLNSRYQKYKLTEIGKTYIM